jgi:hypothetical protein
MPRAATIAAVAAIVALTAIASAQIGGKPATGNPTPGTPQPDPPNVVDRVTFVGCLQPAARRAEATADPNAPSSSRFELTNAESASPSSNVASKTYRLEGIDSQFSPFVAAKVEITGELKPPSAAGQTAPPTLLVEFVQRIAAKCS